MGRVTVVAWPGQGTLAIALAEAADRTAGFPGIGPLPGERPIRVLLAPSRSAYDSLTRGRLPHWSEGAVFPDPGVVVLRSDRAVDRVSAALRHELAHLALRWRVGGGRGLPLWFEEGYAAVAAGEWGRLDALRLNWHVARGMRMNLDDVDRAIRGSAVEAQAAYGLATTAVLLLQRWGGAPGLAPLVDRLGREPSFDAALRATYYVTEGDFEARWQREVASRYGWLGWLQAAGLFWTAAAVLLVWLARRRRQRDRARRASLDEGWELPPDTPTP